MMFLQLTLLTLFIASLSLPISAENVITCGRNIQRLACESGVINIQSALYGRTSATICSANRHPAELANTQCISAITRIADRCNGLRECEFNTNIAGSSDPCPGTFKYFNTTYSCITGRIDTICDNSYKTLSCGLYTINIFNAIYGRSDRTTCASGLQNWYNQNTSCFVNARSKVASLCDGKTTCTLFSSKSTFSDPCPWTVKYLTVSYICNGPKEVVACENSGATLTCGSLTIRVLSANYGRTDSTTCADGRPTYQISTTNCYQTDSLARVVNSCNGKNTCVVPATNAFFTDPCYGTYKYLKISYSCE